MLRPVLQKLFSSAVLIMRATRSAEQIMLQSCAGSVCTMKQNDHFMVSDADFKLLQGEDKLTLYQVSRASGLLAFPVI